MKPSPTEIFNGGRILFIIGRDFVAGNNALWFNYMASEKNKEQRLIVFEEIENKIYQIRELKVMLDTDLAGIYGVETRVLKQAVRRNLHRFPPDFMSELTLEETRQVESLRSQNVILNTETKEKVRRDFRRFAAASRACDGK